MGSLRLFLALSVVMSHGLTTLLGVHLLDGAGSVLVFFAISGFLITIALNKKYEATVEGHLHFYWNRILRLYPMYWIWLAIAVSVYLFSPFGEISYQKFIVDGSVESTGFWIDQFNFASIQTLVTAAFANITGLFADSFLQLDFAKETGGLVARSPDGIWAMGFIVLGQFWSISVEICFYLVAPLFVRSPARASILFLLSITGALGHAFTWVASNTGLPITFLVLKAPNFLWIFMLGSLLAHTHLAKDSAGKKKIIGLFLVAGAYLTVLFFSASLFPTSEFRWWQFSILTAAVPILFRMTSQNRIDKFVGELSYPVYIVHFQIIQTLGSLLPPNGLLFASAAVLVAIPLVLFVDHPISNLKWSKGKRQQQIIQTANLPEKSM